MTDYGMVYIVFIENPQEPEHFANISAQQIYMGMNSSNAYVLSHN